MKRHWLLSGLLALGACAQAPALPSAEWPPAQQSAAPGNPPEPASPSPAAPAATGPLGLEDVLDSVRRRYPPLLAALIERDIAAGRMLSAEGAFDLNLAVKSTWYALGYYQRTESGVALEQATPFWGATVAGGYRLGRGDFPSYYGNRETLDGGEFFLGARVPLLRDSTVDARRAALRQALIDQDLADPLIARARLDFLRAAAYAWLDWVLEARKLRIAEDLLALAEQRNAQIARRVEQGDLPPVDALDNERLVVSRRVAVVAAGRRFQRAAITLSLFYRDERDQPVLVDRSRAPQALPERGPADLDRIDQDLVRAQSLRPELRRLQLQIQRTEVDRELASNRELPNLDLVVSASKDIPRDGEPEGDKGETELDVGVSVSVPLQRRDALGRSRVAQAELTRLRAQETFARDRIAAEIRDAASAVQAAAGQIGLADRNLELARRLAELERRSFELGKGSLVFINLREQQAAEAEGARLDAALDLWRAGVEYRVAVGEF